MTDFRLPDLKPADVDYVNAFAKGYAAPDVMQTPGLANTLSQQKIDEENRLRAGGEAYQKTGDVNALAVAKPMEVATFRELQRKRDTEELLPLMKIGLAYGGGLAKPETFDQSRQSLVGIHQRFDTLIPKTFTPGWYEQTVPRIVQALKLGEKTTNLNDVGLFLQNPEAYKQYQMIKEKPIPQHGVILNDGTYLPTPGPTSFQPRPAKSEGSKSLTAYFKAKNDLTKIMQKDLETAQINGMDAKLIRDAYALQFQDLETAYKPFIEGGGGGQGKPAGGGGAAGKTLIGKTPDGRMVYQDSQGNKFVAE